MSQDKHKVAARLLQWYPLHGRSHLPWRRDATPYKVWVSEIMLQQTRVDTVLPYYDRFIRRMPTLVHLAQADLDEVLHLWSGLGYYARARNLHKAAGILERTHRGVLPRNLKQLMALPGIGRSTAGAVLSLGYGIPAPVLDGNVRRVLTRYHACTARSERTLWALAESHLPRTQAADYSQALMDLGAQICTRHTPLCGDCPLNKGCAALERNIVEELPVAAVTRALPLRRSRFLLIRDPVGRVYLERRPPTGIWGGLWGPPECPMAADPVDWARQYLGLYLQDSGRLPEFITPFSHFRLSVEPLLLTIDTAATPRVSEARGGCWMDLSVAPRRIGLAAPIVRLFAIMRRMNDQEGSDR